MADVGRERERDPVEEGSNTTGSVAKHFSDGYMGWKGGQSIRTVGSWVECVGGIGWASELRDL